MYLHGLRRRRPLKWHKRDICGCMATGQTTWLRALGRMPALSATTALLKRHMRQLWRYIKKPYIYLLPLPCCNSYPFTYLLPQKFGSLTQKKETSSLISTIVCSDSSTASMLLKSSFSPLPRPFTNASHSASVTSLAVSGGRAIIGVICWSAVFCPRSSTSASIIITLSPMHHGTKNVNNSKFLGNYVADRMVTETSEDWLIGV